MRLAAAALVMPIAAAWAAPPPYPQRPEVRSFIADMVRRHGFDRFELERVFGAVRHQASVVRAMAPRPDSVARSWHSYRELFVNERRISGGVEFWNSHAASLARAQEDFGVPEEIIVAIIGVETAYGRNTGNFRVMDALTTLAFDSPRRADFFRSELEEYLVLAREAGLDLLQLRGSYAGAMGIPQFMPGSYRRYAVDFDRDGRTDLLGSAVDAIGSVGNFLREHGWERGGGIAVPAEVRGEGWRSLAESGVHPHLPAARLDAYGVRPVEALPQEAPTVLVELETPGQGSEFWVGMRNFYVLTRYNRSSFYAIAVHELARSLRRAARP